eukprot:5119023-Ditylum_brightwellii.AAC.1
MMDCNNDVNSTTRITWNKKMKEFLQGKQLKDRNIEGFSTRSMGLRYLLIRRGKKRRSTTSITMTTVVHAQRYNGLWAAVATTASCTRKGQSHEYALVIHT